MKKEKTILKILKIAGAVIIGLIVLTFWFASFGEKCILKEIEQCGNLSASQCNIDFMDTDPTCGDFGFYWFMLVIIVGGTFVLTSIAWYA